MNTQKTSPLFAGTPEGFGGLSNEGELVQACPPEFKQSNPWSSYANRSFSNEADIANWKWKSGDETDRIHEFGCFHGLMSTFGIDHYDKLTVAGWMLSEMLVEVPKHVPGKK